MNLTKKDLTRIHEGTLRVLAETGVSIEDPRALEVFSSHGAKVEGTRVFITEDMVDSALLTVPSEFTLKGREGVQDLIFGRGKAVFGSASGCPYVIDADCEMRRGTMEDFENAVKLGHMLPNIDVNGYCVEPSDVSPRERARRTLNAVLTLSDKAGELPLSSPDDLDAACGAMEILHGSDWQEDIRIFAVLNTLSPLRFTPETAHAAVQLAELGQVVCLTPAAMAGFSSPATRAGTLIVQNAEALAGLVLTQLTRPGAPFMYGGTSSIASMRTGDFLVGVPEYWSLMAITAQLAAYYRLPCRAGGALTDSHALDIQAGLESAMGLATVIYNGVDFILHAGGALSSFAAFSFEKFVADDEFLGMVRKFRAPLPTDEDAAALDVIRSVGVGGSYLSEDHTFMHCRDYDRPSFFNRKNYESSQAEGIKDLGHAGKVRYQKMLEEYEPPEMDDLVRRQLREFCLGERNGSCSN